MRRIIAITTFASLLIASPLAHAKFGDSGIRPLTEADQFPCKDKQGEAMGHCISDTLKRMNASALKFRDAEEIEHKNWHLENDIKGVTDETIKTHRAYHEVLQKKRDDYKALEKKIRQQLKQEQNKTLRQGAPNNGWSATGDQLKQAQAKCEKEKDTTAKRICIRSLLHPQTNKVRSRTRGQ